MGKRVLKEVDYVPPLDVWGDRVVVEVIIEDVTKTASGLYIPPTSKNDDGKTLKGIVVRISRSLAKEIADDEFLELEVGNVVLMSQFAGSDAKLGHKEYKILRSTDILGPIEEED